MDESTISALLPPEIAKAAACTYLALLLVAKLRDSSSAFLPFVSNSHRQKNRLRRELEILELVRKIAEEKRALQALGVHEVPNTSLAPPPRPAPAPTHHSLPLLHPDRLLSMDKWPRPLRYIGLLAIAVIGTYLLLVLPLVFLTMVLAAFRGEWDGDSLPTLLFTLVLVYATFGMLRWANGKNRQYDAERRSQNGRGTKESPCN